MLQAFNSLKSLLKPKRRYSESWIFYLHYRATFLLVLFCCVLVSTQQFAWSKISCLSKPSGEINSELLNNYCWSASTYSISSSYLEEVETYVPYSGVSSSENESEYEYRNFYQYVHIVLFIQAILFYIPHLLWKGSDERFDTKISDIMKTIQVKDDDDDDDDEGPNTSLEIRAIVTYIEDRWGKHQIFAFKYCFCEVLALINVMMQSYLLDIFFHGKFLGLGLLLRAYYGSRTLNDPIRLFPLVTICHFRRYGASGYIDVIDALCVLPNNALNAKIFLCLWIWFIILLILSVFNIVDLILCIIFRSYRVLFLKIRSFLFLDSAEDHSYITLVNLGNFGDWFVLSSIRRSMDQLDFYQLTERLRFKLLSYETEKKEPDLEKVVNEPA